MSNRVLLHICCAPCACGCIDRLREDGWEFAFYFSNSNLNTPEEFLRRYEAAQKLANQAAEELKTVKGTYKIRTGKYNKGWRVKETKGNGFVNCTVYNGTNWQLTHLLEKGHVTRNGGKTKAFVHIKPVEEKSVNEYIKDVENIIKYGG